MRVFQWTVVALAVLALVSLIVVALLLVYRPDGSPDQIGGGWGDPCAVVPDNRYSGLSWTFRDAAGVIVATGNCP